MGKNTKGAFSLMEVVVAAVIVAAVFGGVTAIFVNVRRYVLHANRRLVATNLGRETLNGLYGQVRADTWSGNSSALSGGHQENINYGAIDNNNYAGSYQVNNETGRQYRRVIMRVNYPVN
jgi:Tfp pilus assembly protein PilW